MANLIQKAYDLKKIIWKFKNVVSCSSSILVYTKKYMIFYKIFTVSMLPFKIYDSTCIFALTFKCLIKLKKNKKEKGKHYF